MTTLENKKNHFGILTSIDWNSNAWKDIPTTEDLAKSNYNYINENNLTYTFMNFGFDIEADPNTFHSALCPHIYKKLPDPDKRTNVKIIFIKSKNHTDNNTYLVGYYAFPIIKIHEKPSPNKDFCDTLNLCIQSQIKNIVFFDKLINLEQLDNNKILPVNKKMGKQGYNYMTVNNSVNLLDYIDKIIPNDNIISFKNKHRAIKKRILEFINSEKIGN